MQRRNVTKINKHPRYNARTYDYDATVVRLEKPFNFNTLVLPICLPQTGVPQQHQCVVTGWGRTNGHGIGLLKQGAVRVSSPSYCRNAYRHRLITKRMLCAGRENGSVDTCQGDSGGPLQCRRKGEAGPWIVQGITSFGGACGKAGKPGVYTNVTEILPWIKANLV